MGMVGMALVWPKPTCSVRRWYFFGIGRTASAAVPSNVYARHQGTQIVHEALLIWTLSLRTHIRGIFGAS